MVVPTLETDRLVLRGVTLEDVSAIQRHFNNYDVVRQLASVVPWPYPHDGAEQFVKSLSFQQGFTRWVWGIYLKPQIVDLIGVIDLRITAVGENRGFWLAQPFWGQGLMTEAVTVVTNCAFTILGFDKLILANAVGNLRSRRIKEKEGARFLYIEPAGFVDPSISEHEIWELTKHDWALARRHIVKK